MIRLRVQRLAPPRIKSTPLEVRHQCHIKGQPLGLVHGHHLHNAGDATFIQIPALSKANEFIRIPQTRFIILPGQLNKLAAAMA